MAKSCSELWSNINYVLKMLALSLLLAVNYFVLDSYSKYHKFYAFGNGYFFAGVINISIILYAYTWFNATILWEIFMIKSTIIMLIVSTFAFTYDYYHEHEFEHDVHVAQILQYDVTNFAISAGLTSASIIILATDLVLLILEASGKLVLRGRSMVVPRNTVTFD